MSAALEQARKKYREAVEASLGAERRLAVAKSDLESAERYSISAKRAVDEALASLDAALAPAPEHARGGS